MTNREFAQSDKEFREACFRARIAPTQRQASKFRLKSGHAYEFHNGTSIDNHGESGINLSQE